MVTDGEFGWGDGDVFGSAVAPALEGAFADEPRWVDLRSARTEEQLDLNNPGFRAAVADIASAIRGVPNDELESEEVRQHGRTVRAAWAAGAALLILTVAAGAAALYASGQRIQANEQRAAAAANAAEAEAQRTIAEDLAFAARTDALAAGAIAQLDIDPELSLLLGIEALQREPTPTALSATHQALQRHRTVFEVSIEAGDTEVRREADGGMSPDGELLVLAAPGSDLEVWEIGGSEPFWTAPPLVSEIVLGARFTEDGSSVVALLGTEDLFDPVDDFDDRSPSHGSRGG